jgi:signal transduction histidine kinase/ActR/RegA family two-component response regulator
MVAEPAGSDLVVFEDLVIDPTKPITATTDSPYQDVRVSLYASSEPDPDQLVLTTEEEPRVDDSTLLSPFDVGGEEWTLTVAPRGTLTSTIADNAPWMLLGAGALTAVLAAAVTYVVARRRTYALELVAVRTADLRRAQEAADRANRSTSEFLSRMSHELRTPLNAVLGFSQLLEMDNLTEPQRDAVAHIRKSGAHLLELINEVLDISRVESGNMALSPEPVAVADLVTDSVDLVRPLASERGIEVVVARSDAFDAYVLADRQRAKQVLLNLLSNAVKYNRQRGTVAVSCEVPDGGPVRIAVTDTGPGIRPEQVDLLFVPFERLGAEQTEVEGTGIGLALSRNLAEAMGGALTVETTPGRGSTFTLELPAVEGPVERYDRLGRTPEPEPAVPPQQRERTVLHIEDNLSNLTLVERIIARRPGVRVVAAMQGTLGVELAREHKPQLILLDLHLPDMSGEQVLQRLRDDPATASIPVVIVSADATPGQVQRLLAVGAAGYLTKPIEVPELLRHVDDALERA